MNKIKSFEIELKDIDGYFTLTSYYEHTDHYKDYDEEIGEEIIFDEKSIVMLLEHNKTIKNNIVVVRYLDDEEFDKEMTIADLVNYTIDSVMDWDKVTDNIGNGLIVISKVPWTTSDITLYEDKYIRTLSNYKKLEKEAEACGCFYYKYKKLVNGKWSKLN